MSRHCVWGQEKVYSWFAIVIKYLMEKVRWRWFDVRELMVMMITEKTAVSHFSTISDTEQGNNCDYPND